MPVAPSAPRGAFYTTASQANAAAASNGKAGVPVQVKFQTGKGYYLSQNTTAHPAAASASPAGLMTPTQLLAAATSNVNSAVNPQITALNTQAKQQAGNDQGLINGYTNNAVGQVKAIDFGAPYKAAAQDQNAVNTALLANLQGQGSSIQNQLAGLLGGSVDPSVAGAVGGQVAANTAGAGNANLAKGDASLSQILSQGAAAKTYGNSLPGLELLAGQQDTAKTQGAINQNLTAAVGDLRSKVPGLVQSEEASLGSNQTKQLATLQNYALAEIAAGQKQQGEKDLMAYRQAELGLKQKQITTTAATAQARITASQQAAQTKAAAAAGKIDPSVSKILGFAASADGNPVLAAGGKLIPVSKTGQQGSPKAPTAAQISKLVDGWKNGALKSVTTIPTNPDGTPKYKDANGNPKSVTQSVPTGTLAYGQAYKRLRAMGLADPAARQYLNTAYQRGEDGRSWVSNQEQAVLQKAGLPTKAAVLKAKDGSTRGILAAPQYEALKAAHLLPPGTVTSDGHYVIQPGY